MGEAKQAVRRLGIQSKTEYQRRYNEDKLLPSQPTRAYQSDWLHWADFLGIPDSRFYSTLAGAQQAALRLGTTTTTEYKRKYKGDPYLPANPAATYQGEWLGWDHFFLREKVPFYSSLAEASLSALRLGIGSCTEYNRRYKEDARLPSSPGDTYKHEWSGWLKFLGKDSKTFYKTLAEAREAVLGMGIKNSTDYGRRYKEDARLPSRLSDIYKNEWCSWNDFFRDSKASFYSTLSEVKKATEQLGIKTSTEYYKNYKKDVRLPSSLDLVYKDEWLGWRDFLDKATPYTSLVEASDASFRLKIQSSNEYHMRYKEDNRLPAHPNLSYKNEWLGWHHFLQKKKPKFYSILSDASLAAHKLLIISGRDYFNRCKEDARLPINPREYYKDEWQGWHHFLGKNKAYFYSSLADARQAILRLSIISSSDYYRKYKEDPRLPRAPDVYYASEWKSWIDTCLPDTISTVQQLKQACKVLQIKDSQQYREARKQTKLLPSHPERLDNWSDWYELLDIPIPYEYSHLVSLIRSAGCQNLGDYKKYRAEACDPRIPSSPFETYEKSGWTNTYDFFGKPRPYQTRYFESEWKPWAICITEFLKQARGSTTKQQELCQFVREYIQAEKLDYSPHDFLVRTKVNIKPLIDLLNQLSVKKKKRQLYSINEFLDWIIQTDLTIEDEHTGEILRIKNAANPFKHINFDDEQYVPTVNETAKPALPYQFVKAGRDWIFPVDSALKATSYGDLNHLHKFAADWIPISDPAVLDCNDSDCVIKTERGRVYLWNPIFWTYTYSLMQLPARGMQIVYCDSGEMDEEIPDFKHGNLIWLKNPSKNAGLTRKQGMIYKTENGDFGVHYTSNKTQLYGEGYSIPYMPTELAYWLVKLRKWQQKYNSIAKPTPWLECKRTNLNEIQRKHKGVNCFLFRDMYDNEPGSFGGRLTDRLAASLFFSAGDEAALSTYKDLNFKDIGLQLADEQSLTLSRFCSNFTPHSMRVSLINAYAFEFGLPIEVIMKLVGHASIVMSVYYLKSGLVRQKVELGEKQAFTNAQENARRFLEDYGIEEYRQQLTSNNPEILNVLSNQNPSSVYLWKDFGICPVGGNSCNSGGDVVAIGSNLYNAVPAGYIGEQNCPRCRFFVTGPAFLMGLAALYNELTLALSVQASRHSELQKELQEIVYKIELVSHQQYENLKISAVNHELATEKASLQAARRKLNSEIETRAKKMDMFLTDLNFLYRHIQNSRAITQNITSDETKLQLIVPKQIDFEVELEESTQFRLLSEVCENAELFHSCSSELAVVKRSQALDRVMINNGMTPHLLLLSEREQITVGNQLTQLMYARIHSWETIDRLISGELTLKDLDSDMHLTASDIKKVFARARPIAIGDIK
jgi:hypothetical protein